MRSASVTGLKSSRCAFFFSASKSSPALLKSSTATSALDPSFDGGCTAAGSGRTMSIIVAGVRVLDRGPAVRGGRRLVNDEHPERPAAGRLLELVGPPAVVGHRLAVEPAAEIGLEIGIVDEHERDLAAQIDPLEVVPLPLGRRHAVADEDERRRGDGDACRRQMRCADGDVVALPQRPVRATGRDADGDRAGVGLRQRNVLRPGTPATSVRRAARLQAERLELSGDVVHGLWFRPPSPARVPRTRPTRAPSRARSCGLDRPRWLVLTPGAAARPARGPAGGERSDVGHWSRRSPQNAGSPTTKSACQSAPRTAG